MRTPVSTYRLQITEDFDLFEAARRLPYLHDLGVDWVYLSPLLAAEPGSNHGYDVVDHDRDRRRARRRGGPGGAVGRGPPARHGRAGRHRAQPRRRRDAGGQRLVVGRARRTAATRRTPRRSTSTGRPATAGCRIPVVGDDDLPADGGPIGHLRGRGRRAALPRPPLPARARHAPTTGADADDRARPPALRAGQLAAWPTPASTTAASSRSTPRRDPGRGPARCSPTRTSRSAAGSTRASSTGCGSTTPTACATPSGYLDDLAELTGGAYVLVEKILEPGEELPAVWATAGTTGYDALALHRPGAHRPGRPGAAGRARGPAARRPGRLARADPRHQARGRRRHPPLRGAPDRAASCAAPARRRRPADDLEDAVAELLACFPVYRSYLPEGREHLDEAFAAGPRGTGPTWPTTLDVLAAGALRPGAPSRRCASSRPAAW